MADATTGRPTENVSDLLKRLRDDTTILVRQEVDLAKTEISEKVGRVGRNAAYIAAGAMVAYSGLIVLLLAISGGLGVLLAELGLDEHSAWVAPLIVGLVVIGIGYGLVQKAISTLKRETLVPEKTAQSLKEDKEWAQQKVR